MDEQWQTPPASQPRQTAADSEQPSMADEHAPPTSADAQRADERAPISDTAPISDGAALPDGAAPSDLTAQSDGPAPGGDGQQPTVDEVMEALSNVIDPELGLDFVELVLIYGVEVQGGDVHVTFTLTTPGCPIGPQVNEQIEEFVGELEGVLNVTSEMVFAPPWSPEKMSEDAKFALGF